MYSLYKRFLNTDYPLYSVLFVALLSTFGSLYFSDVLGFVPCILCWYQRIFMYPIVLLAFTGLFIKDKNVALYVIPLSIVGGLTAFYHTLLQYGVILEDKASCAYGIPCTGKENVVYGFITIPLLSLMAFVFIGTLMFIYYKNTKKI